MYTNQTALTIDPIPNVNSIKKKRMEKKFGIHVSPGNAAKASGYAMKARPGPEKEDINVVSIYSVSCQDTQLYKQENKVKQNNKQNYNHIYNNYTHT